jgi:eukaryotic-like serine/threonine-protein kinase
MLRLQLLGSVTLLDAGRDVEPILRRPKSVAFLAYLACARPRGFQRRDALLPLFWPDLDQSHARNALRQAVHSLRQVLGAEAVIGRGEDELSVDRSRLWCDIVQFDEHVDAGDARSALTLYRGDLLFGFHLSGVAEFEQWLDREREYVAKRALVAALSLSKETESGRDYAAAASWAKRAMEISPYDESALRRILRLLDHVGRRADAVREYDDFADRLTRDLDVLPSPETRALMDTIRARVEPQVFASAGDLQLEATQPAAKSSREPAVARRWLRLLALLGVLLVGGIGTFIARAGATGALDENLIAVAPFDRLGQSSDSLWSEGLVRVLSAKLDGAGPLRSVSARTVQGMWRDPSDRVGGGAFGRRVGAALAVVGSITQEGDDSMIVNAMLIDAARDRVISTVEARGALRRVDRLADSLAVGLLGPLAPQRPIRAVRLPSIGSASYAALKAFLQGEQFYRRGAMDSAVGYYDRAVALDRDFALAINRRGRAVSWTRGWYNASAANDLLRAARYNHGLGVRDSLLLTADSLGVVLSEHPRLDKEWWSLSSRLFDVLALATAQYPDDAEFWYELGVARLFYDASPRRTYGHALAAFDRAIALDSAFAPAYLLPVELAFNLADSARALRYARAYVALRPTGSDGDAMRLLLRLVEPSADTGAFAEVLDNVSPDVLIRIHTALHRWPDEGEIAVRVTRILASNAAPSLKWPKCSLACRKTALAAQLSFRGHLQEAHAIVGLARQLASDFVLLGVLPPETIAVLGARYRPTSDSILMGLLSWWSKEGDTASLGRHTRLVDSLALAARTDAVKTYWRYIASVTRAYRALAMRDTVEALRRFEALPDSVGATQTLPRLQRVQLLAAVGRNRDADNQLTEGERIFFSPSAVLFALERGRVSERLGDWKRAERGYRYVVDTWIHADSILQPYVAEAQAGLMRLRTR